MDTMGYILTGGFLKGYRTYVMSAVGVITVFASYSVGDMSLPDAIHNITLSLGAASIRSAVG